MDHVTPDCAFATGIWKSAAKMPFKLFNHDQVTQDLIRVGFEEKPIIGHNLKFDLHVLRRLHLEHRGPVLDTLLVCQMENPYRENGLKPRTYETFGYDVEEVDWSKQEAGFCTTDPKKSYTYAAADPVNTLRLAYFLANQPDLAPVWHVAQLIEFPLLPKIVDIETFGIEIDAPKLFEYSDVIDPLMGELQLELRKVSGVDFNPASPDEKFQFLYRFLRAPTTTGYEPDRKGATDDEAMDGILAAIEQIRETFEQYKDADENDPRFNNHDEVKKLIQAVKMCRAGGIGWMDNVRPLNNFERRETIKTIREELPHLGEKEILTKMLKSWSKLAKLRGAFVEKLPNMRADTDGRIHTEFRQVLNSGRQAGKNPNLMQLPRDDSYKIELPARTEEVHIDVRECILPPPGYKFVCADYDAMEMRMAAAVSGCPVLTDVITGQDEEGNPYDPHMKTADLMGLLDGMPYLEAMRAKEDENHERHKFVKKQRQDVKPIGFGLIYGITEFGLSAQLKSTPEYARTLMEKYFETYPGVRDWLFGIQKTSKKRGFADTSLGRRRLIPRDAYQPGNEQLLEHYLRACGNHQIQGGCADLAKYCEVQVADALEGHDAHICNFIHDELVLAVADDPETLCYAGAVLEKCMQKYWGGILFTAGAEVKENLSKGAKDLSKEIDGFGSPHYATLVEQKLGLSGEELLELPW